MMKRNPKEPTLVEKLIAKRALPEPPPEIVAPVDYSPSIDVLKEEISKLKGFVDVIAEDVRLANSAITNIPKPVIPDYRKEFSEIRSAIGELERETSAISDLRQDDKKLDTRINDVYKEINRVINAINQMPARTGRGGLTTLIGEATASTVIFTATSSGYVPASGGGTANYLRADGSFSAPSSGGVPADTTVALTAYAAASAAGTSTEYARGDHSHGSVADLVTGTAHTDLTTGVHGAGTANLATTSQITTHAALTSVHSLGTASTAAIGTLTSTATYAAHTASATSHGAGTIAGLADITDTAIITTDNITSDVSASKHGWTPKASGNTANFLRGDATWATPSGGADPWTYLVLSSQFASTSATTQVVTGLGFTPIANSIYEIGGIFMLRTASSAIAPRVGIAWATGLTDGVAGLKLASATAGITQQYGSITASVIIPAAALPDATNSWPCDLYGMFIAGGTPSGSVKITLQSESGGTQVSMEAKSFLRYRTYS